MTLPALNLSLCGCGFLGVYHLGAAICLNDHAPSLVKRVNRIGGASAGALVGTAFLFGNEYLKKSLEFAYSLADDARSKPLGALTPGYKVTDHVQHFLLDTLPNDSHAVATGKLFVSLSAVKTRKNTIVHEYRSKDHLVQCLVASCFIPIYTGWLPHIIGGKRYIDGGLTNNLIEFNDGKTITISPFAGKQDISPPDEIGRGLFVRVNKQNFQINLLNWTRLVDALMPPRRNILESYYNRGYDDAGTFLRKNGLYETIPIERKETPV